MSDETCKHGLKAPCHICAIDARPPDPEFDALVRRVLAAQDERRRRYEAATPEERARMDREAIEAATNFIMDDRLGGP